MPERDLDSLLVAMSPAIDPQEWVFCCVDASVAWKDLDPIFSFHEREGTTILIPRAVADARALPYAFPSRRITLRVHSDLEAVGFLAAITKALALYGIPINIVSAYHHDHILVPVDRVEEALRVLSELSANQARRALSPST